MKIKKAVLFILVFLLSNFLFAKEIDYWRQPGYAEVIECLEEEGFSEREIDSLFSDERIQFYPNLTRILETATVPRLTSPDSPFLRPESVNKGRKFLKENREFLEKIELEYGVDKEVVVAILRVETNFGGYLGEYKAFSVFNTLMRIGPENSRYNWAKKELIALIRFSQREKIDCLEIPSSIAGAIGIAQFLPSNCLYLAVDGNQDGKVDLFENEDAIASVANYLARAGWQDNPQQAIYAYNPSRMYVENVLAYAQKLKEAEE